MTKVISASAVTPVTVDGITYRLSTPTPASEARVRRGCRRQGARFVQNEEVRASVRAGIAELYEAAGGAEEVETQRQVVEAYWAAFDPIDESALDASTPEELEKAIADERERRAENIAILAPQFNAVLAVMERHYPPYRELNADRHYWDAILAIEYVKVHVVSADGIDLGEIGPDGLDDLQVGKIEAHHREWLFEQIVLLTAPTEAEEKNS